MGGEALKNHTVSRMSSEHPKPMASYQGRVKLNKKRMASCQGSYKMMRGKLKKNKRRMNKKKMTTKTKRRRVSVDNNLDHLLIV